MRKSPTKEPGLDQKLIQVLAHPVRVHALHILNQREASPKELAEVLDFELTKMAYHCRLLEKAGYIELVDLVRGSGRRGGLEHRFVGVKRAAFNADEWAQIPDQIKNDIVAMQLVATGHLISDALESGSFESHDDRHQSLFETEVDEQGWTDAMLTLDEAVARLQEIEDETAERMKDADGSRVRVPLVVSMLGFERSA